MTIDTQVAGAREFLRMQGRLGRETLNGPGSTLAATVPVIAPRIAPTMITAISTPTCRPASCAATAPATNRSESPGRKVMKTSPVSEKKMANSTT